MKLAAKLLNCRVNMTYFVKNHEILFNHFEDSEEQIPWKHDVCCDWNLGNFEKIPEMLGFDGEYPAVQPKAKF